MSKIIFICVLVLSAILISAGSGCTKSEGVTQEGSQRRAEEFVKLEGTFRFDGIPESLMVTGTTSISNGWKFNIKFESRHAGYGNRSEQILAELITAHTAEVTIKAGLVTSAIMDGVWDMMTKRLLDDIEIRPAPIHEVKVSLLKSNPLQIGVYIKGGLQDGCAAFYNIEIMREGSIVNIKVTTRHPREKACPAIYTYFEKNINLGSDFTFGKTYTLNVNDYTTTFIYQ
jgi:hypothetical protein